MSGMDEGGTLSYWQKHTGTLEDWGKDLPEEWTFSGSNTDMFWLSKDMSPLDLLQSLS